MSLSRVRIGTCLQGIAHCAGLCVTWAAAPRTRRRPLSTPADLANLLADQKGSQPPVNDLLSGGTADLTSGAPRFRLLRHSVPEAARRFMQAVTGSGPALGDNLLYQRPIVQTQKAWNVTRGAGARVRTEAGRADPAAGWEPRRLPGADGPAVPKSSARDAVRG